MKMNHLFKDDYLYISYKEKLKFKENEWGFFDCTNYDISVCGNSILPILLYKYSNLNINKVKNEIYDKMKWFKENCEYEYNQFFGDKEIDIFKYYNDKIN
jgi:DNA-binding MltR family transcriptional regulator